MVDLKLLKKRGIDYHGLRKLLAPDDHKSTTPEKEETKTKDDKVAKLKLLIRNRIAAGRESNITGYKHIHAIDLAWETPRRQISTTLLSSMMDKTWNPNMQTTLEAWGFDLNQVLEEVPDPKSPNKTIKRINAPAFTQVFVPLVKAYTSIRVAKLMNDRRRSPFMRYEPARSTALSRIQCETVTARVEMANQHYDYWQSYRQATLQMCLYGSCYIFPKEEWHEVCHETTAEDPLGRVAEYKTTEYKDGQPELEGEKRYERVEKEGIRHKTPHPSRTFADEAHPPSSFNTDTGGEFGGYWEIVRFRDVRNNPRFYNKDRVTLGSTEWWTRPSTQVYFSTVYNTCTINPPVLPTQTEADRESRMADNVYTQHMDDASVALTHYFQKLIPSEFGLGDYDYPVWFRFVVASDDTILYAAPLPYCPVIYMGYDADELRASSANSSLALECLPFQDQLSNLMTQYLLSVRQNLANVTFVDSNIAKQTGILNSLRNVGRRLAEINWIPFDAKKYLMGQTDVSKAFQSWRIPPQDTNGIIQAMKLVLDTLERVLVMSSQEVAQAATHEQTRAEIHSIEGAKSTRLMATGIPIDQAIEAGKRQFYYGLMAYGEDEMFAQVPLDRAMTLDMKAQLVKLGFTFEENDADIVKAQRLNVRVKKEALMLEAFASSTNGEDQARSVEAGQAMLQTLVGLLGSPLYQNIGPDQFLLLINLSAQLMGYPRDFKLKNMGGWDNGVMQQVQQMLMQLQQAMRQEMQQGIVPIMDGLKQASDAIEKNQEKVEQSFENQDHQIKDLAQKTGSEQKDLAREQKSLESQLAQIIKFIDKAPKLLSSPQIIAPDAQINVGANGGNAPRKGGQAATVVATA